MTAKLASTGLQSPSRYAAVLQRIELPFFLAALALVSFSLPGREFADQASGTDYLGRAKVAIRLLGCIWFSRRLWIWMRLELEQPSRGKIRILGRFYFPLVVFSLWGLISVSWSPLFSVSSGQWLGLACQVLLAIVISVEIARPKVDEATSTTRGNLILFQLGWILLFYSACVLAIHLLNPGVSGLDRSFSHHGSNGVVHPTAVGATSSLGIVLAVWVFTQFTGWDRAFASVAFTLHAAALLFSASRAALLTTCVALALCCVLLLPRRQSGFVMLLAGAIGFYVLLFDPGFELIEQGASSTTEFVRRGQSESQIRKLSGREELWHAIWASWQQSPVVGHGYFVTSSNGKLDVWTGPMNHDAHNVMLQVLVSMGIVGLGLFGWVVLTWCHAMARFFRHREADHATFFLLLIAGVWFLVWGQGCVTFLGPIRPESVVFFAMLGILGGNQGPDADASCNRSALTE